MSLRIPVLKMTLSALLVRIALILIAAIWTVPTFGLLISSIRDSDQLAITGWWQSLQTVESSDQARTATSDDMVEVDGKYVISGNIFGEDSNESVVTYGSRAFLPANDDIEYGEYEQVGIRDHVPDEVVTLDDGSTFVLHTDGSYEWTSDEPLEVERGQRFFYVAEVPPRFTLENYEQVLSSEGVDQAFVNTFVVTIPSTVIPIAIAAFAAYAFSWMEFPYRQFLFVVVVGLLVVPLQLTFIPLLRLYNNLGLGNSYPGIWLAHTGFGLPLAIYLLRNYIGGLPREIIESAKIDGASHFTIFVRLALPLSIPALASFTIFQFLWVWNDLLVALVFLGGQDTETTVLTSQLKKLIGSRGENWELLTSAAFISMFVPLIVFFSLQRYFVRGLMAGSVKGG